MIRKTIFISCGQFTDAEKRLGKQIAQMVKDLTNLEPFFAEQVQDLNGLDANILRALHEAFAFIVVLHPRGDISRPDAPKLVRGSVWIEQEIAIATYIQRFENRPLPIIAFKHKSVGLEGIRTLLHLNPIEFTDETEVLAALPKRLEEWKSLKPSGIELQLTSKPLGQQDGHPIRRLEVGLVNKTNDRIESYEFEIRLPVGILKHWSGVYPTEERCDIPGLRCFRFNQEGRGSVRPHGQLANPITFDYCTTCAKPAYENEIIGATLVSEMTLGATAWVNGNEYAIDKTIKEVEMEAERNRG
jgi:hypothetical protein